MTNEFNKKILFDNINYFLKEREMGVGELEEHSGVSTGFCARNKKDEKSKPGIDFIMKAAGVLNIGLDPLLKVEYSALSPAEKYTVDFLDKINRDTLEDKIMWDRETATFLNKGQADINGKKGPNRVGRDIFAFFVCCIIGKVGGRS